MPERADERGAVTRVIVSGSRKWKPPASIVVARLERIPRPFILVHGACEGLDEIADEWAEKRGIKVESHPANWSGDGVNAGIMRNQRMADAGADLLLAFPLVGSRGTWDMIRRAKSAGIPTEVIQVKNPFRT